MIEKTICDDEAAEAIVIEYRVFGLLIFRKAIAYQLIRSALVTQVNS